jgi:hypothetical protein
MTNLRHTPPSSKDLRQHQKRVLARLTPRLHQRLSTTTMLANRLPCRRNNLLRVREKEGAEDRATTPAQAGTNPVLLAAPSLRIPQKILLTTPPSPPSSPLSPPITPTATLRGTNPSRIRHREGSTKPRRGRWKSCTRTSLRASSRRRSSIGRGSGWGCSRVRRRGGIWETCFA